MKQEEADGRLTVYSPTTNLGADRLAIRVDDHRRRIVEEVKRLAQVKLDGRHGDDKLRGDRGVSGGAERCPRHGEEPLAYTVMINFVGVVPHRVGTLEHGEGEARKDAPVRMLHVRLEGFLCAEHIVWVLPVPVCPYASIIQSVSCMVMASS